MCFMEKILSNLKCCNVYSAEETKDEPFAWEAREFLRKKLVGKEVVFTVEYKVPSSGREYGFLFLGKGSVLVVSLPVALTWF